MVAVGCCSGAVAAGSLGSLSSAPGFAGAGSPSPARISAAEVRIVFQVNGKHRGDLLVPVGISQEDALERAKAHEKVAPFLAGKKVVKVVFVPNRILNLVVA